MKGKQSIQRGWKAFEQGDLSLAEREFSAAVAENPDTAFAALQRGLFQLRQDRAQEASVSFQSAAEKEHENPAPLFFLTLARELEGDGLLADQAMESLCRLCPHHQGLASLRLLRELRRGDPLPVLTQLGFGDSPARSQLSWKAALAALGQGDPSWLKPDLSSSQYLLGPILVEVEKRLLPREIPELEHRQENLLDCLDSLKPPERRLREELKGLRSSWKAAPLLRKGRQALERSMGIEVLAEQKTQLQQAIESLEAGHELDQFAFRTTYHLGEAYLFSAKGEPGTPYDRTALLKAEQSFLESARLDGINPYVLFYLALTQHLLGRPQPAIDCYARSTEKFTKLPEAHYGTGQCYLLLGQLRPAREFLLRAVNSDLALARERLTLFANLLRSEGIEAFSRPFPTFAQAPDADPTEESLDESPAEPDDTSTEDTASEACEKDGHETQEP